MSPVQAVHSLLQVLLVQVLQLPLLVVLFSQWTPQSWLLCDRPSVTLSCCLEPTVSYLLSCYTCACDNLLDKWVQGIVGVRLRKHHACVRGPGPCCLTLSSYLDNSLPLHLIKAFAVTRWVTATEHNCLDKWANSDTIFGCSCVQYYSEYYYCR